MYLSIVTKGQSPAPGEVVIWDLAERFGWTLEYIEGLPMAKLHEYLQIQDGRAKAKGSIIK